MYKRQRHGQADFDGIKIEVYKTGFQILVLRDYQVCRIGELLEDLLRHKPKTFMDHLKTFGRIVKKDIEKFEQEDL